MFGKNKQTLTRWTGAGALALVSLSLFALILTTCTLEPDIAKLHQEAINNSGFAVTFMDDSGTTVLSTGRTVGGKVILPAAPPPPTGKTFGWWWYSEDPSDPLSFVPWDFQNNKVTKNITLYASWNTGEGKHSVIFFSNGGDFGGDANEVIADDGDSGDSVSEPSLVTPKTGCDFTGEWNTKADGKGTEFNDAGYTVNGSVAVYAQWNITYSVAANNTDGPTKTTKLVFTFGDDIRGLKLGSNDIVLTSLSPLTKGTLTQVAPNDGTKYELGITGSFDDGESVTVKINKTGIDPATPSVTLYVPVILASGSLGTAGDGEITNLTTGKYYQVIVGTGTTTIRYVKEDGTLSDPDTLGQIGRLTGTAIIGLTNGITYKVIAATPFATTPLDVFDHPDPSNMPVARDPVSVSSGTLTLPDDGAVLWGIDLQLDTSKTYEVMRITSGSPAVASTTASPLWTASKSSGVYDSDSDDFISDDPPKDVGIFIYPVDSGEPTWIRGMSIVYAHIDSGVSSDFLIVYEDGSLKVLTVSVP